MLELRNYFKARKDINEGFESEGFGYLIFQGSKLMVQKRLTEMKDNQVEELSRALSDFNLVKFVNEIPRRKKFGVPVLNLRVKAFKSDQICDIGGVIDQVVCNWDEMQLRLELLGEQDKQQFENHFSTIVQQDRQG